MKLFDTHAHYDDVRFENEYDGGVDRLLQDCFEDCVGNIVNIGTSIKTSTISIDLSEKYEQIYATIGIHPSECLQYESIDDVINELRALAKNKKVVAIGEIGLDYHWDDVPKDIQMLYFEKQMSLASELGLPVVIHDREAHGDCLEMIKKFPKVKGVFHSFSGSAEMARELIKLGWYISFSGTVTYKNAKQPKEACRVVPDDRLLTETDAPYLPPVPHRGELNHSRYMYFTALGLATERGQTLEHIEKITNENARRFFRIN